MGKVIGTTWVGASSDKVWAALADFEGVTRWHPGVASVRLVSPKARGVGAVRHCAFLPEGEATERVTRWQEGRELAIAIDATDLGLTGATVRFTAAPDTQEGASVAGLELAWRDAPMEEAERRAFEAALVDRANLILRFLKHDAETGQRMPLPAEPVGQLEVAA